MQYILLFLCCEIKHCTVCYVYFTWEHYIALIEVSLDLTETLTNGTYYLREMFREISGDFNKRNILSAREM